MQKILVVWDCGDYSAYPDPYKHVNKAIGKGASIAMFNTTGISSPDGDTRPWAVTVFVMEGTEEQLA